MLIQKNESAFFIMKTIFPTRNNIGTCSAIILEKGDYDIPVFKLKDLHVDCVFMPEDEANLYSTEHIQQLIANVSVMGVFYGQLFTYKPYDYERIISTNT